MTKTVTILASDAERAVGALNDDIVPGTPPSIEAAKRIQAALDALADEPSAYKVPAIADYCAAHHRYPCDECATVNRTGDQ